MKRVILIGGAPTSGKSHLAQQLAESLNLSWISTDGIREQMRKIVRKQEYPALFDHADATPAMGVAYLNTHTPNEIVKHHNKENVEVWKGVKAFIETDYNWHSFIVEGIAILPAQVAALKKKHKHVQAVFLIDENRARVRKTIFTRGLWDEARKYPDSVKEKEVAWVFAFNAYIKKEAKKHHLPVLSIGDRKNNLARVKRILGARQ
jgi:2-phosphoglycerate kinase